MKFKIMKKSNFYLSGFFLFSIVLLFLSCSPHLNPFGGYNIFVEGTVCSESYDEEGTPSLTPIPGIRVESNYGHTISDKDGKFGILAYSLEQESAVFEIKFTDVDGEKNGSFKDEVIKVTMLDNYQQTTVTMEKKTE